MQQVMPGVPVQVFPLLPFPLMIMILIIFNTDFVVERLFYYLPVWLRRHLKGFLRSQPPAALGTRFEQE
jgi:hypothetical protein